jgi:hypothetical protein
MRGAEAGLRRKLLLHHVQGEQRRIIYGFHGAKAAGTPGHYLATYGNPLACKDITDTMEV